MPDKPLDQDQILALMAQGKGSGPRKDPTEPRDNDNWFKQDHVTRDEKCDNPDCLDTREYWDRGMNVVVMVRGKYLCRYCFVGGWLSNAEVFQ